MHGGKINQNSEIIGHLSAQSVIYRWVPSGTCVTRSDSLLAPQQMLKVAHTKEAETGGHPNLTVRQRSMDQQSHF